MDRIQTLLASLATLTAEEITELRSLIDAEVETTAASEPTTDNADLLEALADASESVAGEVDRRAEERPVVLDSMAASAQRLAKFGYRHASLAELAARLPNRHKGTGSTSTGRVTVSARTAAGMPLDSQQALVAEFSGQQRTHGKTGREVVAKVARTYPDDRLLRNDSSDEALVASALAPQALVAAGGLCAPLEIDYSTFNVVSAARPLRDALPPFDAARGGVSLRQAGRITDYDDGASVWTMTQDAAATAANGPRKAVATLECGDWTNYTVHAVTMSLKAGNLAARTDPESVAEALQLLGAAHARLGEETLRDAIDAHCTAVTAGGTLGATRELLEHVDRAVAAYRLRHRMAQGTTLRAVFPAWVREFIRSDLTRQAPGDAAMTVSDEEIANLFTVRHISPVWHLDDSWALTAATQGTGVLNPWPATVVWRLYVEGSFLYLDGGTLDLGWVYDGELISRNNRQWFAESFEGVAWRGQEALKITSTLTPTGYAAGLKVA